MRQFPACRQAGILVSRSNLFYMVFGEGLHHDPVEVGLESEYFDQLAPQLKNYADSNDLRSFYMVFQALVMERVGQLRPEINYGIKPEEATRFGTISLSHEFELMWNGGKKSHLLNIFSQGSREAQQQTIIDVVDELLSKLPS